MAKLSPKMWYLLKYGFLALISAGILVTIVPGSKPEEERSVSFILLNDNISKPYIDEAFMLSILRRDVTFCFTKLSPSGSHKSSFVRDDATISEELTSSAEIKAPSTFSVLSSFNNILSVVNIKGAIIEPSILHCMLQPYVQDLLSRRNVDIPDISGSMKIVTYGILGHDAAILQQEKNVQKFLETGFVPYFVKAPLADWMQSATVEDFESETFISHIFYKNKFCTFHIVVFYERSGYLWHASLHSEDIQGIPPKNELFFVEHNGAYEKFEFASLENKILPVADFYIPSTSHYFLFEILTSRFLECNFSRAMNTISYNKHPKSHPGMSVERFNKRTLIALHQLKSIFHPMLMNLWIWSGTMLGWYRDCNIIPYTSDVDFGAWSYEVEDLDLIINLLLNNKHVVLKEKMGIVEEALEFNVNCHGLRTDVFFLYPILNGSWCSGHSPKEGYYFRYYYPHFTLCSAELLGEKVQVPCETEKVIVTEYGPGWNSPVPNWHYESSIRNRGPNIYWDKKKLKNSYRVYL